MTPIDIPTRETVAFLASHIAPGSVVLEVGCGKGEVALALQRHGCLVTALDSDQDSVTYALERGVHAVCASWQEFECGPADTIVFTRSLHHIAALSEAIVKAAEVLIGRGILLLEDFAFDQANESSINWLLEVLHSPVCRELIRPIAGEFVTDLLASNDRVGFWRENHHHDLHSIGAMAQYIGEHFTIRQSYSVPYLYRYLVSVLPETAQAAEFLQSVFEQETIMGERGEIVLIGRRIVASM